jgi:hypothetical protein
MRAIMRRDRPRALCLATLACAGAILTARPAAAQADWSLPGSLHLSAATGVSFQRYTFSRPDVLGARAISLYDVPLDAAMPLLGRSRLEFHGDYAHGTLTRGDGTQTTLSGFTDSQLRIALPIGNERMGATIQGIALLPTGRETLTAEEADLAGILASDLLPFRIADWGSGGAVGIGVSGARAVGDGSLGFGASYLAAREYQPLSQFYYQPGDQMRLQVAADQNIGHTSKLTLALQYEHFSTDVSRGTNLYRAGDRYQAMTSFAFAATPTSSVIVYAGAIDRATGAALADGIVPYPRQRLVLAGWGGRARAGQLTLVPAFDFRYVSGDDGLPDGYLPSLGGSVEWPIGRVVLAAGARGQFGTVGASHANGVSYSLTLRSPLR